jgi:hypothetical protein
MRGGWEGGREGGREGGGTCFCGSRKPGSTLCLRRAGARSSLPIGLRGQERTHTRKRQAGQGDVEAGPASMDRQGRDRPRVCAVPARALPCPSACAATARLRLATPPGATEQARRAAGPLAVPAAPDGAPGRRLPAARRPLGARALRRNGRSARWAVPETPGKPSGDAARHGLANSGALAASGGKRSSAPHAAAPPSEPRHPVPREGAQERGGRSDAARLRARGVRCHW